MRDFFFEGDTSFDFVGEAGGVTGRSVVAFGPGLGSVNGGLLHISSLSLSDLSPRNLLTTSSPRYCHSPCRMSRRMSWKAAQVFSQDFDRW